MLIFAAISPHPPVLIPNIGKNNLNEITKTKNSLEYLNEELYSLKPDTIIIISPHGIIQEDIFTVQVNDKYYGDFQSFGDFETKFEFKSDISFINKIKIRAEKKNLPIQLIHKTSLDHGALVPLYYLTKNIPDVKIVPISFSMLDYQDHFEFGRYLKKTIGRSNKRIALIASGDLSHALTENAPAPYSPKGEIFDKKIIQILEKKDYGKLLTMDENLIKEAKECGLRSFTILSGVLNEIEHEAKLLSYENPFGVGYLVMNFKLI